jgi:DNA-binding transcriptional MerR regulator
VTIRALRYYEAAGLVVPARLPNGYRDYEPMAVRQVEEILALNDLGLSVVETRPFVECLAGGHGAGDECPESHRSAPTVVLPRTQLEWLSR